MHYGYAVVEHSNIKAVAPEWKNPDEIIDYLQDAVVKYGIRPPVALSAFLAQIAHESGGFRHRIENLNYSRAALLKTFSKYFNESNVDEYARRPERIANRAYANRMSNGDEASGDGWLYRGKGFIQLTGKANHIAYANYLGVPVHEAADYLQTLAGACDAAGWFWTYGRGTDMTAIMMKDPEPKKITAGHPHFLRVTQLINGGTNGLADRVERYNRCIELYL